MNCEKSEFIKINGEDIVDKREDDTDIMEYESPILSVRPAFHEYYIENARLQTFIEWPKTLTQTAEQLCSAGFFYTQKEDRVICFCCGGGLYNWESGDEPWEQHALYYGHCNYLQVMKGPDYVASIQEKFLIDEPMHHSTIEG